MAEFPWSAEQPVRRTLSVLKGVFRCTKWAQIDQLSAWYHWGKWWLLKGFLNKQDSCFSISHSPFQTSDCCNFPEQLWEVWGVILDTFCAEVVAVVIHNLLPYSKLSKSCWYVCSPPQHSSICSAVCLLKPSISACFQPRCLKPKLCMCVREL